MTKTLNQNPAREAEICAFLDKSGWQGATRAHLTGDASHRHYERLTHRAHGAALLMDAPPDPHDAPLAPGQKSYGEIAHLADDCLPFVAIGKYLKARGFSAPEIFAFDIHKGLILLEDLGDASFGPLIASSDDPGAMAAMLYEQAILTLAEVHAIPVPQKLPVAAGLDFDLPPFDGPALHIETELLLDWYAPTMLGTQIPQDERTAFHEIWDRLISLTSVGDPVLIQRDYHSPNLIWLAEREGLARVGMIDFQDGMRGSRAYDVASLLQDARRDVPEALEQELLETYLKHSPEIDREQFLTTYAILATQRVSKIIGIFCRLWKREGKDAYLKHLPRQWAYLDRNLAHPALSDYAEWIHRNVPPDRRQLLEE